MLPDWQYNKYTNARDWASHVALVVKNLPAKEGDGRDSEKILK